MDMEAYTKLPKQTLKFKSTILEKLQFMTTAAHEITLKVESNSKAKILGKQLKSYLVGYKFEALFELTNVSPAVFPGGTFTLNIEWPNGQIVSDTFQIPALDPGEVHKIPPLTTGALTRGFALFTLDARAPANDNKPIVFRSASGEPIPSGAPRTVYSFYSILAKEPEEIYEFWGMLIAAFSLAFLVLIELIRLIIHLRTF